MIDLGSHSALISQNHILKRSSKLEPKALRTLLIHGLMGPVATRKPEIQANVTFIEMSYCTSI